MFLMGALVAVETLMALTEEEVGWITHGESRCWVEEEEAVSSMSLIMEEKLHIRTSKEVTHSILRREASFAWALNLDSLRCLPCFAAFP
jgi:hypothetical protein